MYKKINEVLLSNTTVKRRIDEISENGKVAVITALKQSVYFSLQLDESTDVAGQSNLLGFVVLSLMAISKKKYCFASLYQ